jgi:hypothetical protein
MRLINWGRSVSKIPFEQSKSCQNTNAAKGIKVKLFVMHIFMTFSDLLGFLKYSSQLFRRFISHDEYLDIIPIVLCT